MVGSRQLVEQLLRSFQIGGIEALGKPVVNGCHWNFEPPSTTPAVVISRPFSGYIGCGVGDNLSCADVVPAFAAVINLSGAVLADGKLSPE